MTFNNEDNKVIFLHYFNIYIILIQKNNIFDYK